MIAFIATIALLFASPATAGKAERAYERGEIEKARRLYEERLREKPGDLATLYNLGNVRYRSEEMAAAEEAYRAAARSGDPALRSRAAHNLGNVRLRSGDLDGAIVSYIDALRARPGDADARYNLELALRMKEAAPPQEQPQPDSDRRDRQEPRSERQDSEAAQSPPEERQEGERHQADATPGEEGDRPEEAESRPAPEDYAKEDAERVLDGLAEEERRLQAERLRAQGRNLRVEKDW